MVSSRSAGWPVALCTALAVLGGCRERITRPAEETQFQLGLEAAPLTYQAKLVESPERRKDNFGGSVATNGDTAVIAQGGWGSSVGDEFAFVFERSGTVWTQRQVLTGSIGPQVNLFGWDIAMSRDTIVVGAPRDGANLGGLVHVFVRSGSSWVRQQTLAPSDSSGFFGASVAISGDTIVVGSEYQASAFVFARTGSTWTEQQRLVAPDADDPEARSSFGQDVAISGDTLVVADGAREAVHFYRWNGALWAEESMVRLNSPFRVAIEGDTALVSSFRGEDVYEWLGEGINVFVREGATWTWTQVLELSEQERLAGSLALSGETALFSTSSIHYTTPPTYYGSVHMLKRDGGNWNGGGQPLRSEVPNDCFGDASALSAGTVFVGARCDESDYGAVHVFTTDPRSAAPIALSPSGSIDTNWPRYRFTGIDGATAYELELSGTIQVFTAAEAGCAAGTECSVRPSTTLPQGESTWRVRGSTLGATTPWSNSLTVSVAQAAEAPASAPAGIAPGGLVATTTTPTYRWNAVPGATRYTLWVNDATASSQVPPRTLRELYQAAELGCEAGGECAVTPAKALASGPAKWWVRAENPVAMSVWSVALDFTVSPPAPTLGPTLIDPVGSVAAGTVTYRFNSVPHAVDYFLWVNDHTGPTLKQVYSAVSANCANGGICSITPTTPPGVGPRTWWVRGQNLMGSGPWSAGKAFTIAGGSPPSTATLLAPSGSITSTTPMYAWSAVSGATRYQLWVGNSSGRVLKQFFKPVEAGCDDGTCEATPTTPVPAGSATWWIQADNDAGPGAWVSQAFAVAPR